MRGDWTLTWRLSFQLYMQPFIAAGDYHHYRDLATARMRDYIPASEAFGEAPCTRTAPVRQRSETSVGRALIWVHGRFDMVVWVG